MKIRTTYFNNLKNVASGANVISIARSSPPWFGGKEYKLLAPSKDLVDLWKVEKKAQEYIDRYMVEVILNLDLEKVLYELGPNPILVCHCGKNKKDNILTDWKIPQSEKYQFCHRHLVTYSYEISDLNVITEEI